MCKGKLVIMIMMMIVIIVILGILKYIKWNNLLMLNREKIENKIIINWEVKSFVLYLCDEIW